ncbi:transcriptional regulator, AraC family with amidase-like domain [Paraburkholderia steynii]|uniref:Transcriptional regulator, AraC family with amidase-like domain n=1 Tax=Paraburkholderia steynii TaxID=1245441 RepID=A0A7Z7BFM0_9BURK|nr:GlxA family transcriptional regulator [Paraburkholderia steynii]SDJ12380.1 transcriptional regulator, AraC family with amidase-like domain [Paraburkholderia steynii]
MKVAIVVFDGVMALDVAGPLDVFAEANAFLPRDQQYEITLVGMHSESVRCSNGLELKVGIDYLQYEDQPDLLLVAGGPRLPDLCPPNSFLQWLRTQAESCARFGSVCNGAFLLGHAGLLDGKEVTAHWHDVDRLALQFPDAYVQPDKIFVRDGNLFTSAGVAAGVDLCLALVSEDWGHEIALRIAKRLIVYIRREGGQSQYSPYLAVGPKEETVVAKVLRYVTDNISEQLSIEQLADAVGVSRRTFSRIFAKHANMTPSAFVEQIRIDFSRKLLGETDLPLKTVAYRCGFHSSSQMRAIFARRLDTNPSEYRQRVRRQTSAKSGGEFRDASTPMRAQNLTSKFSEVRAA